MSSDEDDDDKNIPEIINNLKETFKNTFLNENIQKNEINEINSESEENSDNYQLDSSDNDNNSEDNNDYMNHSNKKERRKQKKMKKENNLSDEESNRENNEENNEKHDYNKMIHEFAARVAARDGPYQSKIEAYNQKRKPDPSISELKTLGADCKTLEVANLIEQTVPKENSINGPAAKRYIERQPKVVIRGLTQAETDIVKTNHRDKKLWNQIMCEEAKIDEWIPDEPAPLTMEEARERAYKSVNPGNILIF